MSSIKEFYIEKEKRELINTINSAKYVSEEQKEAMIAAMLKEQDVDHWKDQVRDMEKRLKDKIYKVIPIVINESAKLKI